MKRICVKIVVAWVLIFLTVVLGALPRTSGADERTPRLPGTDSLVVLHTNDVHSQLDPPSDVKGLARGGVAARARLLERERARGGRVILLDAGDLVQGTPYYNAFRGEPEHRLVDLLGYDAVALGNHDLDDGPAAWRARARATKAPIVSANVFATADADPPVGDVLADAAIPASLRRTARWVGGREADPGSALHPLARPYVILERGSLKIAVLGLTTYELDRIVLASKNRGVAVCDPIEAARLWVPRLRREADLVIALTHLGEKEDRRLALLVPGIDLVVGGHSHTALRRPVLIRSRDGRTVPVVQAGSRGLYLGRTTLHWTEGRMTGPTGSLLPVRPEDGEDSAVAAFVASYRQRLPRDLDRVVYRASAPVGRDDLREGGSALGNFVADVIRDRTGAEIAIMNAGGIRAGLPAGDITVGDLMRVLPFDNRIVVATMRGVHVRALLDRAARSYGSGGFVHASGVTYLARGGRAAEIVVTGGAEGARGGAPLDGNRRYRVATIDFLAAGGDGYTIFEKADSMESTDAILWQAAADYLHAHPDYRFAKDRRAQWRGATEALHDLKAR